MRISELLSKESISLSMNPTTKSEAIEMMVELMVKSGNIADKKTYMSAVFKREEEGTTGIGEGIAIPHAKCDAVKSPALAAAVIKDGVDYDSLDGEKVRLIFLIAAPDTADNVHLDVLSRLSTLLMDEKFSSDLISCSTSEEFLQIIDKAEDAKFAVEKSVSKDGYRILAVTACPTGIAHTYMAAEALESKAKELGISIKVETDGSGGVKNALTDEEIEAAECIIIAADKNVETARFDGKPVIMCKVAKGIHKPEELIKEAISGNVALFKSEGGAARKSKSDEKEGVGRQIYKHLMNGVSHMLPFVIGGGILIALSFLVDVGNPDSSTLGKGNWFAAFLNLVGNGAFSFMMPVLAGYIAYSIADRPGMAVGFVGGLMATMTDAHAYTQWLTTGSAPGFLGALAAGFLAGYIVLFLKWATKKFPKSLEGVKPTLIYPLIGILLMGAAMYFVINAPFGLLNKGITWVFNSLNGVSGILLGLVLAAMMATDMGGPLNKAAYVFGIAAIEAGNYGIMAAVMIGGMVPPLAIALATTLFPYRFTKKERNDGKVNYIMGMSFITEGAIPFAASDPLRVIPACALGSGLAGALSMALGCTLMAPHGGIFVVAVIGNWYWFLLALVLGTILGAVLLGLFKRSVKEPELGKFKGLFYHALGSYKEPVAKPDKEEKKENIFTKIRASVPKSKKNDK